MLRQSRKRRSLRPLTGSRDSELIRPEQLLRTLSGLASTLVGVTAKLIYRVRNTARASRVA